MAAELGLVEAPSPATDVNDATGLTLPQLLATLSLSLDLSEGRAYRHAWRTALLALDLARRENIPPEARNELGLAALLHDAGVSRIGHHLSPLCRVSELELIALHPTATPEQLARIITGSKVEKLFELMATHCEQGAVVAKDLGLPPAVGKAILHHHERWDGLGLPQALAEEAIPLEARLLAIADIIESTAAAAGHYGNGERAAALAALRTRASSQLDPHLCNTAAELLNDHELWNRILGADQSLLVESFLGEWPRLAWPQLHALATCFADLVDAKSPYTFHHSTQVAHYAFAVGQKLGLDPITLAQLRLAGLFHDLGKLALSNRILDKKGSLTDQEFAQVKEHPAHTDHILSYLPQLGELRAWAADHHERLDGNGYPRGLRGDQLSLPARILTVCDVYQALTSHRPYRLAMPVHEALATVDAERGERYDGSVIDALRKVASLQSR